MKWSLYEGGIRTPLIARWPGVIPPGQVDETSVVGAVDLFPTLASLVGIPLPADYASDGEDMTTVFKGVPCERSHPLFWEYGRKPALKGQGIRTFPYPKEADAKSPNVAVREGRWKLLVNADGSGTELYDLNSDPNETMNRTESEPDTIQREEVQYPFQDLGTRRMRENGWFYSCLEKFYYFAGRVSGSSTVQSLGLRIC